MKRSLLSLAVLVLAFAFSAPDAEARRMGGGMSSGMKRDSGIVRRDAAPAPAQALSAVPGQNLSRPAQPAPAAPAASGMSRWLGPLAGIAAGIGLASLFSHFGMGGGFSSLIMLLLMGGVVFMLVRMWSQRNAAAREPMQYAPAGNTAAPLRFEPAAVAPVAASGGAAAAIGGGQVPADFDVDGFLRQAKLNFVRLQAANDAGNMEDIRAFTTPEMFAEIQMEYHERNKATQQTDVMQLNAVLLDVSSEAGRQIASVRYSGTIRETSNAAPESFDEVWHLVRPLGASGGWTVAGIQQFE